MDKFVCVRLIQANAIDLAVFQFDFDLTFAAFFLNADRTIYGRFGSRSDMKDAAREMSLEGFRSALASALELHQKYPDNKAALAGKQSPVPRFKTPAEYPSLAGKYRPSLDYEGQVMQSCLHCHQVREAERKFIRAELKTMPDEVLFPWPMPDALGLTFDPQQKARIKNVARGSTAEQNGFGAGDEVSTIAGQPILSIADVQWVLHSAKAPTSLKAEVLRGGKRTPLVLTLAGDWRRKSDLSWRPTSWDLRRMATGGMRLEDLSAADRARLKLADSDLALRAIHVGQYNEHAAAKRAGFLKDDIIVSLDGQSKRMTESDLLAYVLQSKPPGARLPATILRGSERLILELPTQP